MISDAAGGQKHLVCTILVPVRRKPQEKIFSACGREGGGNVGGPEFFPGLLQAVIDDPAVKPLGLEEFPPGSLKTAHEAFLALGAS